jgi:uncharacterized protein (TIGR03435 family)
MVLSLILAIPKAHSQAPPQLQPGFEVASIRPTDPGLILRSMQLPLHDGRVTIRGLSLRQLIQYAWGNVGIGEGLHASLISGGPGWMDRDRFDIVAKSEGARIPSRDERKQMLRELLMERFQLKLHKEWRDTAVYALIVGKNGPKMKARSADDGGASFSMPFNGLHLSGHNVPVAHLVETLQAVIIPLTDPERDDLPVLDQTGLTGTFDFELTWSGDKTYSGERSGMTAETPSAPELFTAIQEQLGLRLERRKVPLEILIIDHAEKPTGN